MDAIDRIRAFNRANLRRIGHVEAGFVAVGVTTPEARVLVELEANPGWTTRRLSDALGLNEGYLSRIISSLVSRGWISRAVSLQDKRVRSLDLTQAGRGKCAEIKTASRAAVSGWFDDGATASRVADHLEAAEAGLSGRMATADVVLGPLAPGDLGWLTEQHALHYAQSDGFDSSFEVLVARILADFVETHDPNRERAWIARRGGQRLGSIFCVQGPEPDVAKLRLFFLLPEARGLGLGKRLLQTCIGFARSRDYRRLVLWTHESHRAACALYEKAGFTCDGSKPVTSFGVDLVEQHWSIDLTR